MSEYVPRPIGGNFDDADLTRVVQWVTDNLRDIGAYFLEISEVQLTKLHVEPDKPRVGMVVYADGSDWNPGSGAGFYGHSGSGWVQLG